MAFNKKRDGSNWKISVLSTNSLPFLKFISHICMLCGGVSDCAPYNADAVFVGQINGVQHYRF